MAQRAPLVWIEDGIFVVRDENLPGFRYDFTARNSAHALRWAQQLAEKSWVTREHLAQFIDVAIQHFGVAHL